jgi:hypothetical protein
MELTLSDQGLASFSKRSFGGALRFEGSAAVTVNLQDHGLQITGGFGEVLVPHELLAGARLSKDSSGTIKIAIEGLQLMLNIETIEDTLALYARLEEWVAGLTEGNGKR